MYETPGLAGEDQGVPLEPFRSFRPYAIDPKSADEGALKKTVRWLSQRELEWHAVGRKVSEVKRVIDIFRVAFYVLKIFGLLARERLKSRRGRNEDNIGSESER